MKLQNSHLQADPHVSFLDVIFCLCVFLVLVLSISMMAQKEHKNIQIQNDKKVKSSVVKKIIEEEPIKVVQEEIKKKNINATRFRGRGGQPFMSLKVGYNKENGMTINIAGHDFDWFQFRKLICNLDRRESGKQPALIFKITYDKSYMNVADEDIVSSFNDCISLKEVQEMKKKDSYNYLVNIYKKAYCNFEKKFRDFKIKYTTEYLGNWDVEEVGNRSMTDYNDRKELGNPYIWFTVDNKMKKIILGPIDNPLKVDPKDFVDLIASVQGGDGFYIEYRSPKTLKYDQNEEIPEWVVDNVIEPLGFSEIVSQGI